MRGVLSQNPNVCTLQPYSEMVIYKPFPEWSINVAGAVCQMLGVCLLGSAESVVGAVLLAISLPTMWSVSWRECSRLAKDRAIGRALFLSGFLTFLHVFAFVGVLTFRHTPGFSVFGGRSDAWLYFVVCPCTVCTLVLATLDWHKERHATSRIRDGKGEVEIESDAFEAQQEVRVCWLVLY